MTEQMATGAILVLVTVLIHGAMLAVAARWVDHVMPHVVSRYGFAGRTSLVGMGILWIFLAVTIEIWAWAIYFNETGALTDLEEAVYFAIVCFTTLGFGDITLPKPWRLLSGVCAANGLIIFGWSTAFMVELVGRLRGGP